MAQPKIPCVVHLSVSAPSGKKAPVDLTDLESVRRSAAQLAPGGYTSISLWAVAGRLPVEMMDDMLWTDVTEELAAVPPGGRPHLSITEAPTGPPPSPPPSPLLNLLTSLLSEHYHLPNSKETSVEGDAGRQQQDKAKEDGEKTFGIRDGDNVHCMVLGVKLYSGLCCMAHITPHHWWKFVKGEVENNSVMQQLMRLDSPNHWKNLMFCYKPLEYTFDAARWCVLCYSDTDYRVKVLDKTLRSENLWNLLCNGTKNGKQLVTLEQRKAGEKGLPDGFKLWTFSNFGGKNLDGVQLSFPNGFRPAKRTFTFHATAAIRHAENMRWVERGSVTIPEGALSDSAPDSLRESLDAWLAQLPDVAHGAPESEDGSSSGGGGGSFNAYATLAELSLED